jgi:hypothetical protein
VSQRALARTEPSKALRIATDILLLVLLLFSVSSNTHIAGVAAAVLCVNTCQEV